MRSRIWFVPILAVALSAKDASGQTAQEIISRSVEARGGLAALERRATVKMTAEVELLQQGFSYSMVLFRRRPNLYRSEIRTTGDSVIVRATDGQSAWWINTYMGMDEPESLSPVDAAAFLRQAHIDTSLQGLLPRGSEAVFLDRVEEGGRGFLRVRISHPDGMEAVNFYDAETYLVRKVVRNQQTEGGEVETVVLLSDYRPVDGVLYSFRSERRVGGETVARTTWRAFEHDVAMDDSLFRMPVRGSGE